MRLPFKLREYSNPQHVRGSCNTIEKDAKEQTKFFCLERAVETDLPMLNDKSGECPKKYG
jgi:hypothetical protein